MLNELGAEIVKINADNGWRVVVPADWNEDYRIPTALALIHSEVSEALEAFRAGDATNFAEEMGDALIRILDSMTGLGIDIDVVVRSKLEKNRGRGYRHGGKRV